MFDQMLDSRRSCAAAQSWRSLPIAVLLHAVLLGAVLSVSLLIVRGIDDPRFPLVLLRTLAVPSSPAPPPPASAPAPRTASVTDRETAVRVEEPVQPRDVPDRIEDLLLGEGAAQDSGVGDDDGAGTGGAGEALRGDLGGVGHSLGPRGSGLPFHPDGEVITHPELIPESRVQPEYPELARVVKQETRVILQAIVQSDGTVGGIEVLRCDRPGLGFEEAAIDAVSLWRYRPAMQGGRPVAVYFTVVVDFQLH
jgi:protein TonB